MSANYVGHYKARNPIPRGIAAWKHCLKAPPNMYVWFEPIVVDCISRTWEQTHYVRYALPHSSEMVDMRLSCHIDSCAYMAGNRWLIHGWGVDVPST